MSQKYINLIKKASKRKRQSRLIIKNGIEYYITISSDVKTKFKKVKFINAKKWIIKDVILNRFKIIDKAEIKEIIENNDKAQESYDKCFQMAVNQTYILMLSQKQFESLTRYLDKNDVEVGRQISFIRKGTGFKTHIEFKNIILKTEK